jgi:hypothetical protein
MAGNDSTTTDLVRCSFCGKSHKEVGKLIAGPGVPEERDGPPRRRAAYICNECVALCGQIIEDEGVTDHGDDGPPSGGAAPPASWREGSRLPPAAATPPVQVLLGLISGQLDALSRPLDLLIADDPGRPAPR